MNFNLTENKYNIEEINSSLKSIDKKTKELENSVSSLKENVYFILKQQVHDLKRRYIIESIILLVIEIMFLATVIYAVAASLFKDKLWFLHSDKYNTASIYVIFVIIAIVLFIKTVIDIKDILKIK